MQSQNLVFIAFITMICLAFGLLSLGSILPLPVSLTYGSFPVSSRFSFGNIANGIALAQITLVHLGKTVVTYNINGVGSTIPALLVQLVENTKGTRYEAFVAELMMCDAPLRVWAGTPRLIYIVPFFKWAIPIYKPYSAYVNKEPLCAWSSPLAQRKIANQHSESDVVNHWLHFFYKIVKILAREESQAISERIKAVAPQAHAFVKSAPSQEQILAAFLITGLVLSAILILITGLVMIFAGLENIIYLWDADESDMVFFNLDSNEEHIPENGLNPPSPSPIGTADVKSIDVGNHFYDCIDDDHFLTEVEEDHFYDCIDDNNFFTEVEEDHFYDCIDDDHFFTEAEEEHFYDCLDDDYFFTEVEEDHFYDCVDDDYLFTEVEEDPDDFIDDAQSVTDTSNQAGTLHEDFEITEDDDLEEDDDHIRVARKDIEDLMELVQSSLDCVRLYAESHGGSSPDTTIRIPASLTLGVKGKQREAAPSFTTEDDNSSYSLTSDTSTSSSTSSSSSSCSSSDSSFRDTVPIIDDWAEDANPDVDDDDDSFTLPPLKALSTRRQLPHFFQSSLQSSCIQNPQASTDPAELERILGCLRLEPGLIKEIRRGSWKMVARSGLGLLH